VEGWRSALQAAGAAEPELLRGDWSARSGYEAGHRLAQLPEVSAVMCANDPMALGALRAFAEHGRPVPGEISVVGFDDVPEAAFFLPPLTTVRQDFGELGRRAVHLLLARISGEAPTQPVLPITPDLVVRASTAPRSASPRPAPAPAGPARTGRARR
jgi:DNA-binding LacI/PurR family transcriptional regulator